MDTRLSLSPPTESLGTRLARPKMPCIYTSSTYCRSGISTASAGVSTDDKTATVNYKPVTSLSGNNNALAHYEQSCGYDQISHALSNIHGLYRCSCNLLDVTYIYSLNPGILPDRFSYNGLGMRLGQCPTSIHMF